MLHVSPGLRRYSIDMPYHTIQRGPVLVEPCSVTCMLVASGLLLRNMHPLRRVNPLEHLLSLGEHGICGPNPKARFMAVGKRVCPL